ncbi:SDR family NAD(P)-dependent oxidoreductase [Gryllotalpicola sp.]|uniref:SDR family NAD(P)-dependent oxidoreductase n=1 Tax=Gryllotalpicola sp. TaxID=1932787 RepID=UPI0026397CF8|nr:SDR family NAD(P)-dependent oxidoreductase [Gryllotalpicola sp.]
MAARTIVITGSSSGLGAAAAAALAQQGNRLIVVGRTPDRTRAVAERIGAEHHLADFERLDDVRRLAAELMARDEPIHVLANNAGGMYDEHALTSDGIERTLQVDLVAPFLLSHLLLPRLAESAAPGHPARIVTTASIANLWGRLRLDDLNWEHRPWLGGWRAYGAAKLGVILWNRDLAERTAGLGVSTYTFHPGWVKSNFGNPALMRFADIALLGHAGISPEKGGAPLVALASDTPAAAPSGTHFDRFTPNGRVNAQARNRQLGQELWSVLADLAGLTAESAETLG